MDIEIFPSDTDGEGLRVGVVQARFNESVCIAMRESCLAELLRLGLVEEDIFVCTVPGALEIPFALAQLARSQQFDALIALGAVIRGETYHFEVVSNESAAGIARVALDYGLPVANGVLTCNDDEQAMARVEEKGADAARAAVEMANLGEALLELAQPVEPVDEP